MDIEIRKATIQDIDSICRIIRSAVLTMEEAGIHQWDEIYPTRDDFMNDIKDGYLSIGSLQGEMAVVFAVNQECEPEYADGAWEYPERKFCVLHRLCVDPRFQNKGIARSIVEYVEESALKQGFAAIRLDAYSENPYALRLYDNMDYHRVGTATWRKGLFYLMEKRLGS